jgi:heptosyltransferase-2
VAWSKILVRATNWVGDAVLSLPALRAIRERNPQAHIAILARPWVAGLYAREPFCDEHIAVPSSFAGRLRLARALGQRRFDAAILLPNSFEAALVARLAGIPERIGYRRDGRGFLLTTAIPPPRPGEIPRHESSYYLELLRRDGIIPELPPAAPILLHGRGEARRMGQERLHSLDFPLPVVGISPGAENSRAKQWLPERFVDTATLLAASLRAGVVLFGSPKERALCRLIEGRIRQNGCRVLNLAGETTLAQFVELAAACRVFLANDSGAMHVASALDVPTVAVFGPTDWIATAPAGPRFRILRESVECSPCRFRDCPIDHRCMRGVTAEQVAQAALELVK